MTAPATSWRDHLAVAGLLGRTILGILPHLLYAFVSPVVAPWMRCRRRRQLEGQAPPSLEPVTSIPALDRPARVFVAVGEASGDRLAAPVVAALRGAHPDMEIVGYGGPACAEAGMRVDRDLTRHAVMGVWAVIGSLGFWWRVCAETLARWRHETPDLLLTVDNPGLHGRLAQWARRRGIRTVHLVAPQVWAHSPWRAGRWRRAVSRMLATMPFEAALLSGMGLRVVHVGHPLFPVPLAPRRTDDTRPGAGAIVELWPGSRRREIRAHAALLLAAARFWLALPGQAETRFHVRLAEAEHEALFRSHVPDGTPWPADVTFGRDAREGPLLAAFATSGTATAELAVGGVPVVAFYAMGALKRLGAWLLLHTPWIGLPNLVAGREVMPERLVGGPEDGEGLAAALHARVVDDDAWARTRADLAVVRERMASPDVARRVAAEVTDLLRA